MKPRANPEKYIEIIELVAQVQQIETPLKKKPLRLSPQGFLFIQLESWLAPASN